MPVFVPLRALWVARPCLILGLVLMLGLSGCGLKGDLYVPATDPDAPQSEQS